MSYAYDKIGYTHSKCMSNDVSTCDSELTSFISIWEINMHSRLIFRGGRERSTPPWLKFGPGRRFGRYYLNHPSLTRHTYHMFFSLLIHFEWLYPILSYIYDIWSESNSHFVERFATEFCTFHTQDCLYPDSVRSSAPADGVARRVLCRVTLPGNRWGLSKSVRSRPYPTIIFVLIIQDPADLNLPCWVTKCDFLP